MKIDKGKKIHTRNIKIATYAYDDAHIIVEGELNDNRIIPNFNHKGELHPPGNIHHMFIRLLIEIESIRIVRVEIEMPGIPHQECPETIPSFSNLKGMRIAPGFTSYAVVQKALWLQSVPIAIEFYLSHPIPCRPWAL